MKEFLKRNKFAIVVGILGFISLNRCVSSCSYSSELDSTRSELDSTRTVLSRYQDSVKTLNLTLNNKDSQLQDRADALEKIANRKIVVSVKGRR